MIYDKETREKALQGYPAISERVSSQAMAIGATTDFNFGQRVAESLFDSGFKEKWSNRPAMARFVFYKDAREGYANIA